ncbi:hypothetical protein KC19_3G253200 [Ceratodon purpureus]|uniref:Uncharacterized protein n=1 Tax=Ceratodon purpureus TaxID=3225 RepID=A0A8T0IPC1_CERPU|nr:hypothetical protein KC19_3G253200 [Ceratodon purpureus]
MTDILLLIASQLLELHIILMSDRCSAPIWHLTIAKGGAGKSTHVPKCQIQVRHTF